MFRSSVTKLLNCLIAVMVALLVVGCAGLALHALSRFRDASQVVDQAQADRALFDAVVAVRAQVGTNQTALLAEDNPVPAFEQSQKRGADALALALDALAGTDLDGREALIAAIRQGDAVMPEMTALLRKEAAKPRADRDPRALTPWRDAVYRQLEQIIAASAAISNSLRMKDTTIAETTQVRQTGWDIRDAFGGQCSLLRPYVNKDEKPSEAVVRQHAAGVGVTRSGWGQLAELAVRQGFPGPLTETIRKARQSADQAQAQIDAIVAGLGNPTAAKADSRQWTALCNAPFEPILAISTQALDLAIQHAENQKGVALRDAVLAMLALAAVVMLGAVAILQVRARLARPARGIVAAIAHLSDRDFSQPVPAAPFPDELGAMTSALEQLRLNSAEAERLQRAADLAREAELARAKRVDELCRQFDETVRGVLASISGSAGTLRGTAKTMDDLADEVGSCAATVAASAEEAAVNVNTVAAATEELTASIGEIAERAAGSAASARKAAMQTEDTTRAMDAMHEAAQRVGEVLALINGIAGQTNLLALNATIEAARAGEAGKGFAVVAGEVKALANQTARATEDIGRQVAEIQGTTSRAVAAIQGITALIQSIDQTSSAIAAAVEEQGAATQEISRNVQQAAAGTQQVTAAIGQVAESSRETGSAAAAVLQSVETLTDEQRALAEAIEAFIRQVRQ